MKRHTIAVTIALIVLGIVILSGLLWSELSFRKSLVPRVEARLGFQIRPQSLDSAGRSGNVPTIVAITPFGAFEKSGLCVGDILAEDVSVRDLYRRLDAPSGNAVILKVVRVVPGLHSPDVERGQIREFEIVLPPKHGQPSHEH